MLRLLACSIVLIFLLEPCTAFGISSEKICEEKMKAFVGELDKVFEDESQKKIQNSTIVKNVLKQFFPIKGCNIEQTKTTLQFSKYFTNSERNGQYFEAFFFKNESFEVSFQIDVRNGNSELFAAYTRKDNY